MREFSAKINQDATGNNFGNHIDQNGFCDEIQTELLLLGSRNITTEMQVNPGTPADPSPQPENDTLSLLDSVKLIVSSGLELSAVLQNFVDQTATLTNADYSYISLVHDSGEFLETVAASNDSLNLKTVRHLYGEGIAGEAWRTGATVCASDYKNHPNRMDSLSQARQACGVPMVVDGTVIGVLGIMYESLEFDICDQLELLVEFAKLAAIAIENARIHESTIADLKCTQALSDFSTLIHGATEFQGLLNQICKTLVSVFAAQKAHFYKLDEQGLLAPFTAWEMKDGKVIPGVQSASMVNKSIARWCIKSKNSAYIARGVDDPRESSEVHEIRREWQLGSTVCVPLIHENSVWGVLFAHRNSRQTNFSKTEINLVKIIGNQASIAIHRHELTEKIQYQAYHDDLTGLPNRLRFKDLLSENLETAKRSGESLALVIIDLDGFKTINDSLGHAIGDELLRCVAQRFSKCINENDVLARMGGDEFALILNRCSDPENVVAISQKILDSLSEKLIIDELEVSVGASLGISYFPENADNATDLLKTSDLAMYDAKTTGKSRISTFNQQHARRFEERVSLELDLKSALKLRQFELYFQPKVSVSHGRVTGVEALLRWQHPTRGFVPPNVFIPVAEESGLIQELGGWVLDEACLWAHKYQQQGIDITMAVNISAPQFSDDNFVELVRNTLAKYSLAPSQLELEVTESVVMKNITDVVDRLSMLRSHGIRIAIDDFGTGYSSLQYLEELPLDILKIDKAFVDRLDPDSDHTNNPHFSHNKNSLVKIIVMMAEAFNLETVVEGVETTEQLEHVVSLGCDLIQGYLYSPPVPADKLEGVIRNLDNTNSLKRAG